MTNESNIEPADKTKLNSRTAIRYSVNLSIWVSVIANILFFSFLLTCTVIRNIGNDLDNFEKATELVFLGVVFILGFIGAIPPSLLGSSLLSTLFKKLTSVDNNAGILISISVGAILGYSWTFLLGSISSYTEFAKDPICGLLNGTVAGAVGGAWYGWKMTRRLRLPH
jgi:heme/copper-type cytochrome/quinol oxidase subunit 3